MSAQPSPRTRPTPNATPRPGSPSRGDGARARLTVAPDVARRRLRARLIMWAAALVTVASLFTLVSFHVFAAQSAFTLERLQKDRSNEQLRYERLRLQNAQLSSAATVIAAAKRLGMVQGPSIVTLQTTGVPSTSGSSSRAVLTGASATDGTTTPAGNYDKTKSALSPTP